MFPNTFYNGCVVVYEYYILLYRFNIVFMVEFLNSDFTSVPFKRDTNEINT